MGEAFAQFQEIEQLFSALEGFCVRAACDEGGQRHILHGRKLGQQVVKLEDETDVLVAVLCQLLVRQRIEVGIVDQHGAFGGLVEGADNMEQGGFPRTRCPHDGDDRAVGNFEVDAFQHLQRAVVLFKSVDLNHRISLLKNDDAKIRIK